MTTTAAGDAAVARLNKATEAFEKIITGASNQVVDVPGYGNQPTLAGRVDQRLDETTASAAAEANRSRDEADRSRDEADKAKIEADKAKIEADKAKVEADKAKQIAGLETVADAIGLAALPLPDVWAPLSDSLRMITGYGRDVLVGSDVVARMVNFSRSTTATYIGKDGQLKTAAANEPRFEKEGLLIEGPSTNLIVSSEKDYVTGSSASNYTVETGLLLDGRKAVKFIPIEPRRPVGIATALASNATVTVGWHTASFLCDVDLTGDSGYMRGVTAPLVVRKIRDGLYRASLTVNIPTAGASELHIYPFVAVTITGLQLEALPFATSYIPTNGAAVTRATDVVTIPWGMNVNPATVTVALNYDLLGVGQSSQRLIEYAAPAAPRYLMQVTPAGSFESYCGASPLTVSNPTIGPGSLAVASTSPTRHALRLTGKIIATATPTGPAGATSNVTIGAAAGGTAPMFGHVRNLRIWHRALTNDQLKAVA